MKKGFTLIEIMIAVAIIAILAAIAIPSFAKYRGEAQAAVCASQRNSIQIAGEHWLSKNPDALKADTAPTMTDLAPSDGKGYFKKEPKCPCGGTYSITLNSTTKAVEVMCDYDGHGEGTTDSGSNAGPEISISE